MMAAKKKAAKRKPPSTERQRIETVARVCKRLQLGSCSVRQACKLEDVALVTFLDWANSDESLAEQYARARATGLGLDADDIHELAKTPCADALEAATVKLRVDTLKWDVSKRLPKVYGDRIKHEHDGNVNITVVTGVPQPEGE